MPMSGKDLRKLFEKQGWAFDRQSGSHMIMKKDDKMASIPNHKELAKGTESALLKLMRGEK
jgi:predicted RNA binding protein YcfA (HicA-like mRNA interferase family)